jgi:DNA-binding LacI/PurR family transcriptional regulator
MPTRKIENARISDLCFSLFAPLKFSALNIICLKISSKSQFLFKKINDALTFFRKNIYYLYYLYYLIFLAMKNIPAYMRIRRHILGRIYKSPGKMEKIMSENELCDLFKVSRVTVRNALKGLVDEGLLVSFKGKGTYTNSGEKFHRQRKIIGILIGGGMHVGLDFFYATCLAGILDILPKHGISTGIVNIGLGNCRDCAKELTSLNYDGFIWIRPDKDNGATILRNLKEKGFPVAAVEPQLPLPELDFVMTDMYDLGYKAASKFIKRNLKKTVFLVKKEFKDNVFNGWLKAFEEKNLSYDRSLLFEYSFHNFKKNFENFILNRKNVQGICVIEDGIEQIVELQRENDLFRNLTIMTKMELHTKELHPQPFAIIEYPYKDAAMKAANKLCDMILKGNKKPIKIELKPRITFTKK